LQEQHDEQADRAEDAERREHADEHALGTPATPSACPDDVRRRADRLGRCLEALRPPLEHHETPELDDRGGDATAAAA